MCRINHRHCVAVRPARSGPVCRRPFYLALAVLLACTLPLAAATNYWTGGDNTSVNWNATTNWDNSVIPVSALSTYLIFQGTNNLGTASTPLNQNIANPFLLNRMDFLANTDRVVYLTGNQLQFVTNGALHPLLTSSNPFTNAVIANAIDIPNSTTLTLSNVTDSCLIFTNGALSGNGNLTKAGNGEVVLAAASTYAGTTIVSSGVVRVQNNTSLGNASGATAVGGGGSLQILGSGLSIAEPLNTLSGNGVAGVGALRSLANNTWSGAITLGDGGARINSDGGTLTLSGSLTTAVSNDLWLGGVGSIIKNGSAIAGNGGLVKDGTGTLTLAIANTYTGPTKINAGVVKIQNAGALGSGTGTTFVANGGALQIDGSGFTVTEVIDSLVGASGSGALRNLANNNTWSGNITIGSGHARINSDSGTLTLSGNLVTDSDKCLYVGGAGSVTKSTAAIYGAGSLMKNGAGTLLLTVTNAYTGSTAIEAGILQIGVANALPPTTIVTLGTPSTAGKLILGSGSAYNQKITGLQTSGTVLTNYVVGGVASVSILTVSNTVDYAYDGLLGGGGGNENYLGLTKQGAGKLTLSGNSTYTGTTTLNGGTLQMNHANALGNGGDITFTGGTLQFGSIVSNSTVALGARIKNSTGPILLDSVTGKVTISGNIPNTNTNGLTKTGAGTVILSGANTYLASTRVNEGTLRFTSAAGVGGSGRSVIVLNGVTVGADYALDNSFLSRLVETNAAFCVALGANSASNVTFNASTGATLPNASLGATVDSTYSGTLTPNGTTYRLGGGGATLTVSSALTGGNAVVITGPGTVVLSGNNTYSGTTTLVTNGVLTANSPTALGNGGDITFAGGAMQFGSAISNTNLVWGARIKNSSSPIILGSPVTNAVSKSYTNALHGSVFSGTPGDSSVCDLSGSTYANSYTRVFTGPKAGTALARTSSKDIFFVGTANAWTEFGGSPGDNFVVCLSGTFFPTVSGSYNFRWSQDDKGWMFIDVGQDGIFDASDAVGSWAWDSNGSKTLTAGQGYNFMFFSQEFGGGDSLNFWYTVPGSGETYVNPTTQAGQWRIETSNAPPASSIVAVTISGDIPASNTGGLIKNGSDSIILAGTNTYGGFTWVNGGTLGFQDLTSIGGVGRSVIVTNGAVVLACYPLDNTFLNRLYEGGNSFVVALGTNSSNNLDFNTSAGANLPNASLGAAVASTYSGALTPNGTTYRLGGGGATMVVSSSLGGGGCGLVINHAGSSLILSNAMTYTGPTLLTNGTLVLANGIGSLDPNTDVTLASSTLFNLGGNSQTLNGLYGSGTLTNSAGLLTILAGEFPGVIQGGVAVTKSGSGTLALTGANTFTGATTVAAGTLILSAGTTADSSSISSISGLQAWYDASQLGYTHGQTVSTWPDRSGNNHTATLSGGTPLMATNLVNGQPAVQFRNNNCKLNAAGTLFAKSSFYVFRCRPDRSTWSNYGNVFGKQADDRNSSYLWENNTTYFHGNQYPSAVSKNGAALVSPFNMTTINQFMVLKIVVNDNNTSPTSYMIGGQGGYIADMDAAEIIVFNRTLTTSEENSVGGYLASKYGITTTYPAYSVTNTASPIVVNGGSLVLTNFYQTNSTVTVNNDGILTIAQSSNTCMIGTLNGAPASQLILSGDLKLYQNTNGLFYGGITGAGGLIKYGSGTLSLGKVSTYSGQTTLMTGGLRLDGGDDTLSPNSVVSMASGTFIDLNGHNQTFPLLTGSGMITNSVEAIPTLTFNAEYTDMTNTCSIGGNINIYKTGPCAMTLSVTNSYNGTTTVRYGNLLATCPQSLGRSMSVYLEPGAQLTLQSSYALTNTATVSQYSLESALFGKLQLDVNITVTRLFWDDVIQPAGTYGSSQSLATHIHDGYFSGPGMLTVIGGGGNVVWSGSVNNEWDLTNMNWTAGGPVTFHAGDSIRFDDTGTNTTPIVPTTDVTASSANFWNQVVDYSLSIASGRTVKVTGPFAVGTLDSNSVTRLAMSGEGSFVVADPTADFQVGGSSYPVGNSALLNLSGLSLFSATVNNFQVGDLTANQLGGASTVLLARTSAITSSCIRVGGESGRASPQVLTLGSNSTTLCSDSIYIGHSSGRSDGSVQFAGSNGTLTVRAMDGTNRANLYIAAGSSSATNTGLTGTLDTRGHAVDLRVGALTLADRSPSLTLPTAVGNSAGFLYFDAGTLDVDALVMGRKTGGTNDTGALTNNASVSIGGGTVNIGTGGVVMAYNAVTNGGVSATLSVTGGVVTVNADIRKEGGLNTRATLSLTGGTLDLAGHAVGDGVNPVDTVTFTAGTIRNLGGVNGGVGVVKTTAGTLTFDGTNTFGTLVVSNGTVVVATNGALSGVSAVHVYPNATLTLQGTNSLASSARLTIYTNAPFAKVQLSTNATVGTLYLESLAQSNGTWGATGSGAQFINNNYFSGTGKLTVAEYQPTYSQNFDLWPRKTTLGSYTNNGWVAKDVRIQGDGTWTPASPTNAAWLDDFYAQGGEAGPPWVQSPLLTNGIGQISVAARSKAAGFNIFAIKTSPDGVNWVTNGVFTNTVDSGWTTWTATTNTYESMYVRIEKVDDDRTLNQYLGIDDIVVGLPLSYLVITNVTLSPDPQYVGSNVVVSATITPKAFASNVTATLYYSTDYGVSYWPVSMTTPGSNDYVTSAPHIPALATPGSRVQYYIMATFIGATLPSQTNTWPASAPTASASYLVRSVPLRSPYANMTVKGSVTTNMLLTGDSQWQGVIATNLFVDPSFYFNAAGTNWAEANQSVSNLPVYGTAETGVTTIAVMGTITNRISFLFNDTNLAYSIENCAFADFEGWPAAITNSGTNAEGWILSNGRISQAGETNGRSFHGNFCVLPYNRSTQQWVRSPAMTNGIGAVSFWYRNYNTNGPPPCGFAMEKSLDGTNWMTVTQIVDVLSVDYLYYSALVASRDYRYVRVVNATNDTGTNSTICLDRITVTEPGAIVALTNPRVDPPSPTNGQWVSVFVDFALYTAATNPVCSLHYRPDAIANWTTVTMAESNGTFWTLLAPTPAGPVYFYFTCAYEGFNNQTAYYLDYNEDKTLAFTNLTTILYSRTQNFHTWAAKTAFGNYSNEGWYVNDSRVRGDGNWAPYSVSNAAWLNHAVTNLGNQWVKSPFLTNGIGGVYFMTRNYSAGSNVFSIETSPDGITWSTNAVGTNISYVLGDWTTNFVVLNSRTNQYVLIRKLMTTNAAANCQLGIDDIVVSFPPSDVLITNIWFSPWFPATNQPITVYATITSMDPNFPAYNIRPLLAYTNDIAGGPWQTNAMALSYGNVYTGTLPPAVWESTYRYFIRCDFDGYYYTNGPFGENISPAFSPEAPRTADMPPTNYPCVVRKYVEDHDSIVLGSGLSNVTMTLIGDYLWRGVIEYDQSTNQLSLALNVAGYFDGTNYSAATNSFSDPGQPRTALPMYGYALPTNVPLTLAVDTQFFGNIVVRYNTATRAYDIRRGSFQDFNKWNASDRYFEESLDIGSVATTTNSFNNWEINTEYVQSFDQGNFQTWNLTTPGTWLPDGTWCTTEGGGDGWYVGEARIIQELTPANKACMLKDEINRGAAWPAWSTLTLGLKNFTFRYRCTDISNISYSAYSPGSAWSKYSVQANMRTTNVAPTWPSLSMYALFQDANNYYEYRLQRTNATQHNVQLFRRKGGALSNIWSSAAYNNFVETNHLCRLDVVSNNSGTTWLGVYYDTDTTADTLLWSGTDSVANALYSGTVGFKPFDADIVVDNVAAWRREVQKFEGWYTPAAVGVYSNAGWVINNGFVQSYDYARLTNKVEVAAPVQTFDAWAANPLGDYTNNSWILHQAYVSNSVALSSTNAAWLPGTNAWLETPYLAGGLDTLSFYARNDNTSSIELQVQISTNGSTWTPILTATNSNPSYSYKAKITFSGYQRTEALSNFPVLVVIGTNIPGFSYTQCCSHADGIDLRFRDSTETTVLNHEIEYWNGYEFSPTLYSGLSLWLKADAGVLTNASGVVTNWLDQSGNGSHVNNFSSDPTVTNSGLRGKPSVYFDGDDMLWTTTNLDAYTQYSIITVARYTGGDNERVISSRTRNWLFGFHGACNERWYAEGWIWLSGSPANTNWHLHTGTINNDADPKASFWMDGVLKVSGNTGSGNGNHMIGQLELGGQGGGSEMSKCEVAEVLVYNRVLSSNELAGLQRYLGEKYGNWDTSVGTVSNTPSYVWVQVPALSSSNDYIWAYWGSPTQTNIPPSMLNGATWSNGYLGVWHMAQVNASDSTANRYGGSVVGNVALRSDGVIGSADTFVQDRDYVEVNDNAAFTLSTDYTVSAWVNTRSLGNAVSYQGILGTYNGSGFMLFLEANSANTLRFFDGNWRDTTTSIPTNTWKHVAYTRSGVNGTFYVDGVPVTFRTDAQSTGNGGNLQLGAPGSGWTGQRFDGNIDEVRLSTVARSSNWIWAAYMNQFTNSAFCTYGAVTNQVSTFAEWTPYSVDLTTSVPVTARIAVSKPLDPAACLVLDDATVSSSSPYIQTPYMSYGPGLLKFQYQIWNKGGNTNSIVRVRGSADGRTWTTLVGGISNAVGGWYNYTLVDTPSLPLQDCHYLRIENASPYAELPIQDIFIDEAVPFFTEEFSSGASGWNAPYGSWYVNTNDQTYCRNGYAGPTITFLVETNYCAKEDIDYPHPPIGGDPPWVTAATLTASNMQYQSASINAFFWDNLFVRVKHTSGYACLVVDDLTMTSWRGVTTNMAGNLATMGWVSPIRGYPTDYQGLAIWLTADTGVSASNGLVNWWLDQSGCGRNAAPDGVDKPTYVTNDLVNGEPYVRFDGSNDRLVWTATNAQTVFLVTRMNAGVKADAGLIGSSVLDIGIRRTNSIAWSHPGSTNDFTSPVGSEFYVNGTANASANTGVWHIVAATRGGDASPMDALGWYVPNREYKGDIAEVIVYSRRLFTNEQNQVGQYLATKYGLTTTYTNDPALELWRSRCDPAVTQVFMTAEMSNGLGTLTFDYRAQNPDTAFVIERTSTFSTNVFVTVTNIVATNLTWSSYAITINESSSRYVRIVHTNAGGTNAASVLLLDNMQVTEYRPRTDKIWAAYNALITDNEDANEYEPQPAVRTCFLNNSPAYRTREGVTFTNNRPYVQSSRLSSGIGEISFMYRHYNAGSPPSTVYLYSAPDAALPATNWTYLGALTGVLNTDYREFVTNVFQANDRFLRICSDNTGASAILCVDNITVLEPLGADLDVYNVTLSPEQPLYTNTVTVTASLKNFLLNPSNIVVRAYYHVGTNPWAAWPAANYVTLDTPVGVSNAYGYTLKTSVGIPPQNINSVVQYYVWCTFDGLFATNITPKIVRTFTNPPWYHPVNLNAGQAATNPYYFSYSCPTGSVWINELNVIDIDGATTNQFIELCGRKGSIISNWWLEVMIPGYSTNAFYWITNNATLQNENSSGHGFWLLASNRVSGADQYLTKVIPNEAGVRLRRSVGPIEQAYCFGDDTLVNQGKDMTNSPAERFVYIGFDDFWNNDPDYSLSVKGTNSPSPWDIALQPTPGGKNQYQTLTDDENPPPETVEISISNFWMNASTIWIVYTSSSTNLVGPRPLYSTNLLNTTNWIPIPSYTTTYSSGIYTQWFTKPTNSPVYFYKVVGTNTAQ